MVASTPQDTKVGFWKWLARKIIPEFNLKYALEETKYKLEKSQTEEQHLNQQLWDAHKQLEHVRAEYRELGEKYNEVVERGRLAEEYTEQWASAYTSLEKELLALQQKQQHNYSPTHHLHDLKVQLELHELLFPSPDDFKFLSAAIQIYKQPQDTPLEAELELAFTAAFEKSSRYQQATLTLANTLVELNSHQTAMSLYQVLYHYKDTEQSIREQAKKHIAQASTTSIDPFALLQDYAAAWEMGKHKLSQFTNTQDLADLIDAITHSQIAITLNAQEMLLPIRQHIIENKYHQILASNAKTLRDKKKSSQAITLYEFLTIIEPDNFHNHYFLGTVYEQTNQLESALEEYKQAGTGSSAKTALARIEQKLSALPI